MKKCGGLWGQKCGKLWDAWLIEVTRKNEWGRRELWMVGRSSDGHLEKKLKNVYLNWGNIFLHSRIFPWPTGFNYVIQMIRIF